MTHPRDRLLRVGLRLFVHQGFHATGISQLIDEASVARATFYAHFPAKIDLYVACLEDFSARLLSDLDALADSREPGLEAALAILDVHRDVSERFAHAGCPLQLALSTFPAEGHALIDGIVQDTLSSEAALVARHLETAAPGLTRDVREARAQALVALVQGLSERARLLRSDAPYLASRPVAAHLLGVTPSDQGAPTPG